MASQDISEDVVMTVKVEDVIAGYIKLRDKKEEMETRHKEELKVLKDGLTKMEGWLARSMLSDGVDSYKKNGIGTAFFQRAVSTTVKDWSAALDFIRQEGEWSLLEARVSKTAIQDYLKEKGELPPGVELNEIMVVRVRR